MKIALAQQNYIIGDLHHNYDKIKSALIRAKKENINLCIFSELSLTGYPPQDNFNNANFLTQQQLLLKKITAQTKNITAIVGAVYFDKKIKKKFNAAFVFQNKKLITIVCKSLLPNYDIFNENRYFTNNTEKTNIININNIKIAITICEDIWNDDNDYPIDPIKYIKQNKVQYIINLSASPFSYSHYEARLKVIKNKCVKFKTSLLYCNAVGGQTDLIFDGGSMVVNPQGQIIQQAKFFEEDFISIDTTKKYAPQQEIKIPIHKNILEQLQEKIYIKRIFESLILGIGDYFKKSGFKKAILGSSGGIDSAVVQTLLTFAIGEENVVPVLLPSSFSSNHSVVDATILSQNLNNNYHIVDIKNEYETFLKSLQKIWGVDSPFSLAEENLQSRIRGNMLMALSNKYNYLLINTSNKSELAMGYGTLYGDMAGAFSVLGDLYKTQVYALAHYINKNYNNIIPQNILIKDPSAELKPNQKDSDSLPDYKILDTILYYFIEDNFNNIDLKKKKKFSATLINKIYHTYLLNEYKRTQFCPILRVSQKSFGRGRQYEVITYKS